MISRYLLLLLVLAAPAEAKAPMIGVALPAKCVSVHDGDTLTLDVTIRVKVRLLDCWAPEIRGGITQEQRDAGIASQKHLESLALNQPAILFVPFTGAQTLGDLFSFERILGYVWVNDINLSDAQTQAGYAKVTRE